MLVLLVADACCWGERERRDGLSAGTGEPLGRDGMGWGGWVWDELNGPWRMGEEEELRGRSWWTVNVGAGRKDASRDGMR